MPEIGYPIHRVSISRIGYPSPVFFSNPPLPKPQCRVESKGWYDTCHRHVTARASLFVLSLRRCDVFHGSEEPVPMTYLSEDPTYLAGGLLLLAGAFGVAFNVTRQGKYLVRAGIALGLALVVVAVEWFWVTDNERIEQVVYDLRQAVLNSDVEGVLIHMAPNVQYLQGDTALSEDATRALIKANLSHAQFEFRSNQRLADQCRPAIAARESRISGFHPGTSEFVVEDP